MAEDTLKNTPRLNYCFVETAALQLLNYRDFMPFYKVIMVGCNGSKLEIYGAVFGDILLRE